MLALKLNFTPNDTPSKVKMRLKFSKVNMKRQEDPGTIFEQISRIEMQYTTATFQANLFNLIATAMSVAPDLGVSPYLLLQQLEHP